MEWLIILIIWIVSLFFSYKVGKKVEEKSNETDNSNARADAVSRGYNAGSAASDKFIGLQNK